MLKPSGDAIAGSSAQRKIEIMWEFIGRKRPSFAEVPGPGQESVWDYPRPPKLVADKRHVVVRLGETVIADSHATVRILETAGPPTFYIPPKDVHGELLRAFSRRVNLRVERDRKILGAKNFGASASSNSLELSDRADAV